MNERELKIVCASVTMSSMKKTIGERGSMDVLLLPVIILAVLFVAAASFAVWAFAGRQDYKNNSDAKSAAAVAANKQVVQAADAKTYAEAAKNPLKTYSGPDAYGSVRISYPKTWSSYVDTTSSSTPLNAYFHTDYVPSTQSKQNYQLRIQVAAQTYDHVLSSYSTYVNHGTVTSAAYSLPKVPSVVGTRLSGAIFGTSTQGGQGTIVLIPLRDKTLEIWTESNDYLPDFNTYILPNVTFSP